MNKACTYQPIGRKGSLPGLPFYLGLTAAMVVAMLILSGCQPSSEELPNPFPPATQIASFGSLPHWSPDGQKLVFGADGAQSGIWLFDRSSGNLTQITDGDHPHLYDYRISQSNDKIAFGGAGASIENTSGIWVVGLDGSDPVRWHTTGHSPCWMPNDEGLVFAEDDPQSGTYGLFRLLFADTSLTGLTDGGMDPQYNSAGTKIAYREPMAGTTRFQLKVITPAGVLTNILADSCAHFCWTDSDNTIVFDFQSSAGAKICRVPVQGGTISNVVVGAVEPSAAANGRVAYQSVYSDLSQGIRTTDLSGADIQLISAEGYQPVISTDGSALAYATNGGIWLVNL